MFPDPLPSKSMVAIPRRYRKWSSDQLNFTTLDRWVKQNPRTIVILNSDLQWISIADAQRRFDQRDPITLRFLPEIVATADEIVAAMPPPFISVHIRQTDFVTHTPHARATAYFFEQVTSILKRSDGPRPRSLLISSDDDVVVPQHVTEQFELVRILQPRFSRTEAGAAPEAMSHILTLAAGTDFVPSPMSSFSELVEAIRSGTIVVSR
jgi:hypothetical protein